MHPKRKKKLIIASLIILGSTLAVGFSLYALNQNINLYYTPAQVAAGVVPVNQEFRIGGFVADHSIRYPQKGVEVDFVLTDHQHHVPVEFQGVLPDLFREGQGVVVMGHLTPQGQFIADQVLAKHSADYMPPAVRALPAK